ncbi:AGE family epimerase/isomerase [Zobellia galactanivorans]|nr:AGE family epimerase/isomerase [Zobellia galactanivorans]MBU3027930.1 AGE family epimerase/isomerase [Zobellia galactanivorans]
MRYSNFYKDALLNDIIPFWEKNSLDKVDGGYFSCLDNQGKVYDTDKFMWLQARQAWIFSMLYGEVEQNSTWLNIAKSGIDFIVKNGMDGEGNFYFSTTRSGSALVQPYNIFTDCFAAMALCQYGKVSGDEESLILAEKTYQNIRKRSSSPKGIYEKNTGGRQLKSFALPMILANLVLELEGILKKEEVNEVLENIVHDIMYGFLDKETGLIFESVRPDGTHDDSFEGRLINPGHGLEAMWFVIDIAARNNDKKLIEKAVNTIIHILEYAWDNKYGGIYYFMDVRGKPPLQLEHDQKLWWVHLEALIALAKAYECTKDKSVFDWFQKVHNYAWTHFSDQENGEWFGYLNREGKIHLNLKGGKWKGCFHTPRAMYQCWKSFEGVGL